MDKYNPEALCPKCGDSNIISEYRSVDADELWEETIRRKCNRCGYEWAEEPIVKIEGE